MWLKNESCRGRLLLKRKRKKNNNKTNKPAIFPPTNILSLSLHIAYGTCLYTMTSKKRERAKTKHGSQVAKRKSN